MIGDFEMGADRTNPVGYGLGFTQLQTLFMQVGNVGAIQMTNGDVIVLHSETVANPTAVDLVFG